jgi:hypothetical protein
MTRLTWDPKAAPPVRTGISKGVLYFRSYPVQVWNGLSSVVEKDDSAITEGYFDGQKFIQVGTPSSYSATVDAYTYPTDLESRDVFDLSYRVELDTGYELHVVYNAVARVNDKDYETLGGDISTATFSWDISTIPVAVNDYRATAHLVINSNNVVANALSQVEDLLYGTNTTNPRMPTITEIFAIFEANAVFVVVDNGDGSWTATGPDSWFTMLDATTFQIVTPSAEYLDPETYRIRSW